MSEQAVEKTPINRREFLNIAWLASLGFLFVNLGGVTFLFAMPRFKEGEFGGTFTLGSAASLPAVNAAPVNYPKAKFWLSNSEAGVTALYKVCTHLGCLYNWNDQEGKFICPCHGSQFTYDGSYILGPAPRALDRFVVQAIDPDSGEIIAQTGADGKPLAIPPDRNVIIRVDTGARINGPAVG
ncbi:MAG: ubiquinol-cytochrome c reductase iron-sulfur subunit [Anaerolineales bacterium]|nr:ubiquinol-cytochrome c reductase iron-sulfur subunit [Anaerolineales bacterium]